MRTGANNAKKFVLHPPSRQKIRYFLFAFNPSVNLRIGSYVGKCEYQGKVVRKPPNTQIGSHFTHHYVTNLQIIHSHITRKGLMNEPLRVDLIALCKMQNANLRTNQRVEYE